MFAALVLGTTLLVDPAVSSEREIHLKAAELVAKLSESSYRQRQWASNELMKLGSDAIEPLRHGLTHRDPEVADRCRQLLSLALDQLLLEHIEAFVANPDGPVPDDLPGIQRWIKIAGTGKDSRQLYALVVRDQRHLLADVGQHPERVSQLYRYLCLDVYFRTDGAAPDAPRATVSDSELGLFLLLGADPEVRNAWGRPQRTAWRCTSPFLNSKCLRDMLAGNAANEAAKKLFVAWLEQQRGTNQIHVGYQLAAEAKLQEAAPVALRLAADRTISPTTRSYALIAMAKFFGPAQAGDFEALLDDDAVLGRPNAFDNTSASTEFRDIALAIAALATGQQPVDYGFDFDRAGAPGSLPSWYARYARTGEQREQAFAQWKEWSERQKK